MPPEVRVIGINGMPEITSGDPLGAMLVDAALAQGSPLESGDVLVVTQKVVSKAEGRVVSLQGVEPSPLALQISEGHRRDPRHTEMILRESRRIVRMDRGAVIAETRHGFNCANAGIDASNIPGGDTVCLLPVDSDASARGIRRIVKEKTGADVAVIISDTFGRPWRNAAANVAIGVAGINPSAQLRGTGRRPRQHDVHNRHRRGRRAGRHVGTRNRQGAGSARGNYPRLRL